MTISRRLAVLSAALVLIVASACSAGAPSAEEETTASPRAADTPNAGASAAESEATSATPDTTVADAWEANAIEHRGLHDEQFEYDCPAGGEPGTVWGTDIYTDDSSICTAAVHAGVITIDEGGTVTIEMRPGEDEYEGSERNGIETQAYPAWSGSFVIVDD